MLILGMFVYNLKISNQIPNCVCLPTTCTDELKRTFASEIIRFDVKELLK
jgi:hypothetical protein